MAGQWMSLLACVGILALALLVLLRGKDNPLKVPVGLWALVSFIWNFATLAYKVSCNSTCNPTWHLVDISFSPLVPPLSVHIILVFVGRARPLRWLLALLYAAFGAFSLASLLPLLGGDARGWIDEGTWSIAYLGGWIPLVLWGLWLLVRHLRRSGDVWEQMRTRLIIAALIVGAVFGATELWDDWLPIPALGHVGALGSALLLAAVVKRFELFGREVSISVALYASAVAGLTAFAYVLISRLVGERSGLLVLGLAAVTVTFLAATWDVATSMARAWVRMKDQAGLGAMAEQIAHDLKSPLTALKGGIQFLNRELVQGRSIDDKKRFLELAEEQVRRIQRVLRKYPLLPDVQPVLAPVDLNALVASVLDASQLGAKLAAAALEVRRELDPALPPCSGDEDLLAGALENLVANARDAMQAGGVLTVRTVLEADGRHVRISVADTGVGMDPRQLQLATERYYTTKQYGSGLGLAWVRRITEAHQGRLELVSVLGEGTAVHLLVPVDSSTTVTAEEMTDEE